MALILFLYTIVLITLTLYVQRFIWLAIYAKREAKPDLAKIPLVEAELPLVTVQLPIYNEGLIVTPLIDSVCRFDYPPERLEIQVLDDSTDQTSDLIAAAVAQWQQQGVTIKHLHRPNRQGYKAGNLAYGLAQAKGTFIAIFDADFRPEPSWLRHTLAHFFQPNSQCLGMVQTRWEHTNGYYSPLTYAQVLNLNDFHFGESHRTKLGLWIPFYGSGGLWRKVCIEEVGGWLADTTTEDIDIAYRAQLAGWQISYDDTILASAELPNQMLAYKQQQFRWAKGTIQVSRKLLAPLLQAPIRLIQKIDTILFFMWPVSYGLYILLLLLKIPQLIWPSPVTFYLDVVVSLAMMTLLFPSLVDWYQGRKTVPIHWLLQTGICVNNSYGFLMGLFGQMGGVFHSTPKVGTSQQAKTPQVAPNGVMIGELIFLIVVYGSIFLAIQQEQWLAVPLLLLYLVGTSWVVGQSVWEAMLWYWAIIKN